MYIEQTWNNGDVITSAKMNHIEDGIANAQSTADGAASSVNALSANGAIGTQNLANGAVTDAKLASNAVTTAKVADGAVTMPKLGADVNSHFALAEDLYDLQRANEIITNDLYDIKEVATPYTAVEHTAMKAEIENGGYVITGTKNKAALYPFKDGTYNVNGLVIVISGNSITIDGTATKNTIFSLKDGCEKTNAELASETYELPNGNWYISCVTHSNYQVQQSILCRKKDNSGVITLNPSSPKLYDSASWGGFYIYVANNTTINRGTVFCISNDDSIGAYQKLQSERVQWLKDSANFIAEIGDCIVANSFAEIYTVTLKTKDARKAYLRYSTRAVSNSFAVEVIDVYITMPTGYVDYIFAHCQKGTVADGGCDLWKLIQIDKVDGAFIRQYHITAIGETEMAIRISGRDDFIGGTAHGDEWLNSNSALAILDGNMIDVANYTTLTPFEQFEFFATTTLYDPSDHASIVGEHGVKWTFTKDGLDLRQSVKFNGSYTMIGSHMPMICAVRDHYGVPTGTDYETFQITDTYADDGNFNHYDISVAGFNTYPNKLKKDVHAVYMYGSEKDIRIAVEYIEQPTGLIGEGTWLYNGNDYNKLYNTICGYSGSQDVSSDTKWQVHAKIYVTANK